MDNTHYAQKVKEMMEAQELYKEMYHSSIITPKEFDAAFFEKVRLENEVLELTTQILTPPQELKVSEINFMDATDSK